MLAYLWDEAPAASEVRAHLIKAHSGGLKLHMNIVNLGEVYYRIVRARGSDQARDGVRAIRRLPISVVQAREPLVMAAAQLKATYKLSYADAFAVATARELRGPVLTGDPEILALPPETVESIRLVRRSR